MTVEIAAAASLVMEVRQQEGEKGGGEGGPPQAEASIDLPPVAV